MSQDTSDFLAQWLTVVATLGGIIVGGLLARRSYRRAAHWREVEARQKREREAANAPAFCQHCSALIPKIAGVVRYCQRCGQPPDGSALIVRVPPTKPIRERPGKAWLHREPNGEPRVSCGACGCRAMTRTQHYPARYKCGQCGNVAQEPIPPAMQPGRWYDGYNCDVCGSADWDHEAGNVRRCRTCGNAFIVRPGTG